MNEHSPLPDSPPPLPINGDSHDRLRWRICFWLFFLLTPVATVTLLRNSDRLAQLLPVPVEFLAGGMAIAGALSASYCLTKLHVKPRTTGGVMAVTIVFTVGIFIVYAGIAFVGCVVALSKSGI